MSFDCKRITRRRLLQGVGVLIAQSAVASKRADAGYFDEDASTRSATWRNEVGARRPTLAIRCARNIVSRARMC